MKTRRNMLSLLTAFCMALTLVPMPAFAADAAGDEAMWGTSTDYGTSGSFEEALQEAKNSDGEFYIKLLDDVKLTKVISSGKQLTLDLAGKTITAAEGEPVLSVSAGTFTLNDSSGSNKGMLTGGTGTSSDAGGVTVKNAGTTFIMNGGSIAGNEGGNNNAPGGVKLFANTKFIMNGGSITNNIASNSVQCGVYCNRKATFEVSGTATIIGNKGSELGKEIDSDLWMDTLNGNLVNIGSSGLAASARIGIYMNSSPEVYKEFTHPYAEGMASAENFITNRTKYYIGEIENGGQKQLVLKLNQAAAPTASVAAGTYEEELTVSLATTALPDYSQIYYTLDGSDPITSATRKEYTEPIKIRTTTTLKAYTKGTYKDLLDSEIAEFIYEFKEADYGKVDAAIQKAAALNKNHYKDFSAVEAAVQAVVRDKNVIEQAEVDAMAKAIEDAIHALEYKSADYSKVDKAIARAKALHKDNYKDFSAVEAAIKAVVREKNITEQAEVDAMAKAIEDAINGLEKKTTKSDNPSESKTEDTSVPKTGDNSNLLLWITWIALSGGTVATVVIKKRKGSVK